MFYKIFSSTGICKSCRSLKRQKHREQERSYRSRISKEIKEFLKWIKDIPCMDCNVRYPSYVMDFDHKDQSLKKYNISNMSDGSYSYNTVWDEIIKCDIVCSNCHRIRTFSK